ncbi:MAG: hypothetical protein MZV64_19770 [Ignavibacteriales bacterium]|nr:hypothetical protein [Ignavibacteriales bacterium]
MAIDQVHVLQPQASERTVDPLDQPLAVQRVLLVHAVMDAPVELGRNEVTAAPPLQLLERRLPSPPPTCRPRRPPRYRRSSRPRRTPPPSFPPPVSRPPACGT